MHRNTPDLPPFPAIAGTAFSGDESGARPLVSIVINNYNYGLFVEKALNSALDQTYPNIEIIVVDDGSTDNSREILSRYTSRVRILFQKNRGQAGADNTGFLASKGEFVLFLDSDDWLMPDAIEKMIAAWRPGMSALYARIKLVDSSGNNLGFTPPKKFSMTSGDLRHVILRHILPGHLQWPSASGFLFNRKFLQQVFPLEESTLSQGVDSCLRPMAALYGLIGAVETPLACYQIHFATHLKGGSYILKPLDAGTCITRQELMSAVGALVRTHALQMGLPAPRDLLDSSMPYTRVCYIGAKLKAWSAQQQPAPTIVLFWKALKCFWLTSGPKLLTKFFFSAYLLLILPLPTPLARHAIAWIEARRVRRIEQRMRRSA